MNQQLFEIKQRRTVKGKYRASVIGSDGKSEISTTGWKSNLILNCGLDKLAHMAWSQVFQFCVAGDALSPSIPAETQTCLDQPRAINSFYYTESGYCGHSVSGNVVTLYRTFDFYMEDSNITYTELGFKESPGTPFLFSRVVLDPPQKVHAGQFLRVSYQLIITLTPSSTTITDPPTITGWTTGTSDTHRIQKYGLSGVDSATGMSIPVDSDSGFCNEIFAPGTRNFGPGFGYVNRWKNGSAANYVGSPADPATLIGPLKAYFGVYQNPHQAINKFLRDGNSSQSTRGAIYLDSTYQNYLSDALIKAMATYHGYGPASPVWSTTGVCNNYTFGNLTGLTQPVSGQNLTHCMQAECKYEPNETYPEFFAGHQYFFDPALGDPDYIDQTVYDHKSYSPFVLGSDGLLAPVRQPDPAKPYWQNWSVSGSSCFLSTTATALAAVGSCVDRSGTSFEVPLRLDPYKNGSIAGGDYTMDASTSPTGITTGARKRTKYAVFDALVANNTWASLGIGPTSTSITPASMLDAAKYNGYSYVFNTTNAKANTHFLRVAFTYIWDRA